MFTAASPGGGDTSGKSNSYWAQAEQATQSYFSSERTQLFVGTAVTCYDSVSTLVEISALTAEAPPVSILAGLGAGLGFAGCIVFSVSSVIAPESSLHELGIAANAATPLGLGLGTIGGFFGEKYLIAGLQLGGALDAMTTMSGDMAKLGEFFESQSFQLGQSEFGFGKTFSLLGNEYNFNNSWNDSLKTLWSPDAPQEQPTGANANIGSTQQPGQGGSSSNGYGTNGGGDGETPSAPPADSDDDSDDGEDGGNSLNNSGAKHILR